MSGYNFYFFFLFFLTISYAKIIVTNKTYEMEPESNIVKRSLPGTGTLSMDAKDIHFYVYSDPEHPSNFNEVNVDDIGTLENANLVPGQVIMLCQQFGGISPYISMIKDAYLNEGFQNIIIVSYDELVTPQIPFPVGFISYFAALQNVPTIGNKGADFINFLYKNKKIKGAHQVHLVGWSIGAHVASSIGYTMKKKYKMKVGRITGLDTAGPFSQLLKSHALNKKHAIFVDAIHTDIDGVGTPKSVGHADFFINGGLGKAQADCKFLDPISTIFCAHSTSPELYLQSITKKNTFTGCTCVPNIQNPATSVIPTICLPPFDNCKNRTVVGEYCPTRCQHVDPHAVSQFKNPCHEDSCSCKGPTSVGEYCTNGAKLN